MTSQKVSTAAPLNAAPSQSGPSRLENAARRALDRHVGRAVTDAEWARARARLVEFATILRTWQQKAPASERQFGNVISICQSKQQL